MSNSIYKIIELVGTSKRRNFAMFKRVLNHIQYRCHRAEIWRRRTFEPKVVRHHGIRMLTSEVLSPEMRSTLFSGQYEDAEYQILSDALLPCDRVLEFGTGLGFVTTFCCLRCGSESVVTYEANPGMETYLRLNWKLNGVSPTLRLGLVSDRIGSGVLHVSDQSWSSSIFERNKCTRTIDVPLVRFSMAIEDVKPTFVVMDIEGGEVKLVREPIPPCVSKFLIEYHESLTGPESAAQVHEWLLSSGFALVRELPGWAVRLYERTSSTSNKAMSI